MGDLYNVYICVIKEHGEVVGEICAADITVNEPTMINIRKFIEGERTPTLVGGYCQRHMRHIFIRADRITKIMYEAKEDE